MEKKCCICGKEFNGFGNNSVPVRNGTCCDKCNVKFILPGRMYASCYEHPVSFEVVKSKKDAVQLREKLESRDFELIKFASPEMPIYQNVETEEAVLVCLVK